MENVKVFSDIYKLSRAAAEQFITISQRAISERGIFNAALSGGGTPETLYALLATEVYARRVNWEKTHLFWSDERCVDPLHVDSNYRMAYHALIKHVPLPSEQVHRIYGDLKPEDGADLYERHLHQHFDTLPRFDLILLGLDADGHIASLFPHSEALKENSRWAVANFVPSLRSWRITLTIPIINHAAHVTLLVTGSKKAEMVKASLKGEYQPDDYPAHAIKPVNGQLNWLLDEEAAALLS